MLSEAARKDAAMSGQLDYDRIALDFYPTPPKFVRCLAEHFNLHGENWWEPAAGKGDITGAVEKITGKRVFQTDIFNHMPIGARPLDGVEDFFAREGVPVVAGNLSTIYGGIITNPPYETVVIDGKRVSLAEAFLRHALKLTEPVQGKVAMFLRNEFDCGKKRMDLFKDHPAYAMKVVCTERPRWIAGSTGSPRHNYSWFVFDWKNTGPAQVRYSHPTKAKPITLQ